MYTGIPQLPDLTHPNELLEFGSQGIQLAVKLGLFLIAFGVVLALINGSNRRQSQDFLPILKTSLESYILWLQKLPHFVLLIVILSSGFFLCSTLANRYHHWEQEQVVQVSNTVAGERLEQAAPRIRYQVEESYIKYTWVDGRQVEEPATRLVDRYLAIAASQVQVKIDQATDPATRKLIYSVGLTGEYEVTNLLKNGENFFFEAYPPYGYSVLQDFQVEQNGQLLNQVNPGDYGFPFRLAPGASARFQVTYQAQGAPRWVYQPNGQALSDFRLTILANFAKADFAGAIPTITREGDQQRELTWIFKGNVSVQNPLGVFTATEPISNTGILPRLLLLAPAIFLWWILLLYLSMPMKLKDVAISAGIFFACLLTLTYGSRLLAAPMTWGLITPILMGLSWGLGGDRQTRIGVLICTLSGLILPVFGLLIPYSGLTLSLAGLLSGIWISVRNGYGYHRG
ncbi:MAG: hypothetical protein HC835_10800 [Oscillatoriales cyanobacterium RM2_1_1]|nr:hypothetical protein [Oscillatoriales cyanobacterium RM2_1_1]